MIDKAGEQGGTAGVKKLNNEIEKLNKKIDRQKKELQEIEDDIDDKEDDLEEVEEELEEVEEELEEVEEELENNQGLSSGEREALEERRDTLEREKRELESRINSLNTEISTLTTEKTEAETARDRAIREKATLETERDMARAQIDRLLSLCGPEYTSLQTDTNVDFRGDSPNGPLYSKIGSFTGNTQVAEGQKALKKYLTCHSDPSSIIKIQANLTWAGYTTDSGRIIRHHPVDAFNNDILELLDASNDKSDWSRTTGDNTSCETTKNFAGDGDREETLQVYADEDCPSS